MMHERPGGLWRERFGLTLDPARCASNAPTTPFSCTIWMPSIAGLAGVSSPSRTRASNQTRTDGFLRPAIVNATMP